MLSLVALFVLLWCHYLALFVWLWYYHLALFVLQCCYHLALYCCVVITWNCLYCCNVISEHCLYCYDVIIWHCFIAALLSLGTVWCRAAKTAIFAVWTVQLYCYDEVPGLHVPWHLSYGRLCNMLYHGWQLCTVAELILWQALSCIRWCRCSKWGFTLDHLHGNAIQRHFTFSVKCTCCRYSSLATPVWRSLKVINRFSTFYIQTY